MHASEPIPDSPAGRAVVLAVLAALAAVPSCDSIFTPDSAVLRVTDTSGTPIAGAVVRYRNGTGVESVVADADGVVSLPESQLGKRAWLAATGHLSREVDAVERKPYALDGTALQFKPYAEILYGDPLRAGGGVLYALTGGCLLEYRYHNPPAAPVDSLLTFDGEYRHCTRGYGYRGRFLTGDTMWTVGWTAAGPASSVRAFVIPDTPPMHWLASVGGPVHPTWVVRYDSLLVVDTHGSLGEDSVLVFAGSVDSLREVAAFPWKTEDEAFLFGHRVVVRIPGAGYRVAVIDLEATGGPALERTLDLGSFMNAFQRGRTLILGPTFDAPGALEHGVTHRQVSFGADGAYVGTMDFAVDGFLTGSAGHDLVTAVVPLWYDPGGGIRLLDPSAGWATVWTWVEPSEQAPFRGALTDGWFLFVPGRIFELQAAMPD